VLKIFIGQPGVLLEELFDAHGGAILNTDVLLLAALLTSQFAMDAPLAANFAAFPVHRFGGLE
jgi:hypothetical protein